MRGGVPEALTPPDSPGITRHHALMCARAKGAAPGRRASRPPAESHGSPASPGDSCAGVGHTPRALVTPGAPRIGWLVGRRCSRWTLGAGKEGWCTLPADERQHGAPTVGFEPILTEITTPALDCTRSRDRDFPRDRVLKRLPSSTVIVTRSFSRSFSPLTARTGPTVIRRVRRTRSSRRWRVPLSISAGSIDSSDWPTAITARSPFRSTTR